MKGFALAIVNGVIAGVVVIGISAFVIFPPEDPLGCLKLIFMLLFSNLLYYIRWDLQDSIQTEQEGGKE